MAEQNGHQPATMRDVAEVHNDVDRIAHYVAKQEAEQVQRQREKAEETRAIRRNRNRFLTLLVTLMSELLMPVIVLPHLPIPKADATQAMILLITIPDAFITGYAYLRRY